MTSQPTATPPGTSDLSASDIDRHGCLLAVRVAGATFGSEFDFRSDHYAQLLVARTALRRRLAEARSLLLDLLHHAVAGEPNAAARRALLKLKRDLYNHRPCGPVAWAPAEIRGRLEDYASMRDSEAAILDECSSRVAHELVAQRRRLLANRRYRLGCRYSSEALWADLQSDSAPANASPPPWSPLGRGFHAYAAKFVSKANPFHVFAAIGFPARTGLTAEADYEVVLDAAVILAAERRVLPQVTDTRRVWLQLQPFTRVGATYQFWVNTPRELRVLTVRDGGALCAVLDFFESMLRARDRPVGTRAELDHFVRSAIAPDQVGAVSQAVDALTVHGVISSYLVTDFGLFAPNLRGIIPELDEQLASLERWHLAPVGASELEQVEAELAAVPPLLTSGSRRPYYVNSYVRRDLAPHEDAARLVHADLSDLRACFGVEHNRTSSTYAFRHWALDYLSAHGGRASYLQVLHACLRDRVTGLARYDPSAHRSREESDRRSAWFEALASQVGELTSDAVQGFCATARLLGTTPASLCFNGPFDYVRKVFYVGNVFAGGGRFATRYLLGRTAATGGTMPAPADELRRDETWLDVEVAPHFGTNLHYVVPTYPTGCGFDARYAHRFRRWVRPQDVTMGEQDEQLGYWDEVTGRRLRFHYRGFLLAHSLPLEYQLLLVGHADVYRNPFERDGAPSPTGFVHFDPGLTYGSVCVRRAQWSVRREALDPVCKPNVMESAIALRDWIHEHLAPEEERWYYRVAGAGRLSHKPRLLDLLDPASASAAVRTFAVLPPDTVLRLTRMQPPVEHLSVGHGGPRFTELMIEA